MAWYLAMADMRYANVDELLSRIQGVVEFLDTKLTDVNQKGMFGNTPLKVAVVWGDLDAVRMLIDAGADVNAKTKTIFQLCTTLRHTDIWISRAFLSRAAPIEMQKMTM